MSTSGTGICSAIVSSVCNSQSVSTDCLKQTLTGGFDYTQACCGLSGIGFWNQIETYP